MTHGAIREANIFVVVKSRFDPLDLHFHAYKLFTSRLADFCILNDNGYKTKPIKVLLGMGEFILYKIYVTQVANRSFFIH